MSNSRLEEIRQVRLDKLQKLIGLGVNPYPAKFSRSHISVSEARDHNDEVSVAGRLWRLREHGNVIFADLKDNSGQIQLLFQKKNLEDKFSLLKLFDVGDFLGVTGKVISTQAGEITVDVSYFEILSKSLRPIPDDWYGLKDEEERYRHRYVDLMLDDKLRDLFVKKSVFWDSMRRFLQKKGFMEVETPVLENVFGGADANPFITHHNALDLDLYLRISMGELWQKRLMVAGFEKTFEIGRQFRNEGISREHLQDYTQMEFYWAYANFEDSMNLVEEMYRYVAKETFGKLDFDIYGHHVDLSKPWARIDYTKTILDKTGKDVTKVKNGREMDELWKKARKTISGPAFLVGHPVEVSPLAKRQADKPDFVERYQVIIAGSELGNGYSELNDPVDQARRFQKQQELRDQGDQEAQMYDRDFVEALEYGMPPVTGFGVSERLFSFLADKTSRECVLFPLLRPEK
jgi:lysyl-tRNA synthetase class 2